MHGIKTAEVGGQCPWRFGLQDRKITETKRKQSSSEQYTVDISS